VVVERKLPTLLTGILGRTANVSEDILGGFVDQLPPCVVADR
jgi:hypothetical protein